MTNFLSLMHGHRSRPIGAGAFVKRTLATNSDPEMTVYMIAAHAMMAAGVSSLKIAELMERAYATKVEYLHAASPPTDRIVGSVTSIAQHTMTNASPAITVTIHP